MLHSTRHCSKVSQLILLGLDMVQPTLRNTFFFYDEKKDFSYFHYTKLQSVNYHVVKIILKDLLTLFSLQFNSKLVHYTTYFCVSKINITLLVTKYDTMAEWHSSRISASGPEGLWLESPPIQKLLGLPPTS